MFGLNEDDINKIIEVTGKYDEVEEVLLFGSRAKGNFKNGSDIDIALKGKLLSRDTILSISMQLNEETIMPYHFDVLDFGTIKNQDLINHIKRNGKLLYKKQISNLNRQQ